MHGHESKEEMECCLAAHKKEIVGCLAVMVVIKLVIIGIVCTYTYHNHHSHHQDCCKPEGQTEE